MTPKPQAEIGAEHPLGAHVAEGGTNFAVASEVADAVEVCLFDDDGTEQRIELPGRSGHVWHGFVPGVGAGQRYGLRVEGPWNPSEGVRCNPAKLLLDPWATAIDGDVRWDPCIFGHRHDEPFDRDDEDSAPSMPRCVVTDGAFDWGDDAPLETPLDETVIYETHVKGMTKRHPEVPPELQGTYAGLVQPAVLDHLARLGVTAVELLPVHQFVHESHLLERGLRNYWGYNTIGFFAPHHAYSATGSAGEQVDEFKSMVKDLHAAGLEVIIDVVYNHTAEGNHLGPTLSFKGIDNPAYYRLAEEDRASYYDTTGTGNSVNVGHPMALRLIMDSLRYWRTEMHVDGFRFDLAAALTRQHGELDIHSAFLDLVDQDPSLAGVKLIAEPWDVAGYQLGGFPARWSEWNGRYRDTVRDYWRGESTVNELVVRLLGSPDVFGAARRRPTASVNYVTSHDGFTLADLTSYNEKHNEDNGDDNADGETDNRSWNCGAEGETDDGDVLALRRRQRRNLLGTLLCSAGVPMVLGGDELGRTQSGNNNGYCHDDELSWFDWSNVDSSLCSFVADAIAVRRAHPALRQTWFADDGDDAAGFPQLLGVDGQRVPEEVWQSPDARSVIVRLEARDPGAGDSAGAVLLVLNGHYEPVEFKVPDPGSWKVALSSADDTDGVLGDSVVLDGRSFALLTPAAPN